MNLLAGSKEFDASIMMKYFNPIIYYKNIYAYYEVIETQMMFALILIFGFDL